MINATVTKMAAHEKNNLELPGISAKRGRKPTGKAKSGAERQRRYRANKEKAKRALVRTLGQFDGRTDEALKFDMQWAADEYEMQVWAEIGRRRGWLVG